MEYNKWDGKSCIYRPPNTTDEPIALNATLGVKFSNDVFLMKSFLDQQKIPYEINELEDGPLGLFLRIKKDVNQTGNEF